MRCHSIAAQVPLALEKNWKGSEGPGVNRPINAVPLEDDDKDGNVLVAERPKAKKARRWAVVFYNDDYTTKWFVVMVLQEFFRMGQAEATAFMMAVHRYGKGAAAFYTRDIAETKAAQVMDRAREFEMPLKVAAEPEDEGDNEG